MLTDYNTRLKVLENKPAALLSKWETSIIGSVVGLIAGFVIAYFS